MWQLRAITSVMRMRIRIAPALALVFLVVLFLYVRGHTVSRAPAPVVSVAAPPPISQEQADRLDRSGDDLFWTTTRRIGSGATLATVSRAHGDAVTVVYRESGVSFGDVAGGRFVVVNDDLRGASRIKRIDGGGTLATSERLIGRRDLLTDGAALYWTDDTGVHTVAVGGGNVRNLARSAAVRSVALDGGRLYFAAGNVVRSVGTGGEIEPAAK